MSAKMFRVSTGIIAVVVAGVLLWSILAGLPVWVPALAVIAAILIKFMIRRNTTDALTDERQTVLGNRAGTITFRVLSLVMALAGLLFIVFKDSLPAEYETAGTTLAFSVCAMLLVYIASYVWLNARS